MEHTKDLVPVSPRGVMPMGRVQYALLLREVLLALWLHRIQGAGYPAVHTFLVAWQTHALV